MTGESVEMQGEQRRSRFARRYRIVTAKRGGYLAQYRDWWLPVWFDLNWRKWPTVEGARDCIAGDKKLCAFRQDVVEIDHG